MARLNSELRLLMVKLVYVGPGLSGKTTNLACLHREYPEAARGELVQRTHDTEGALRFDFFPAKLGTIEGYRLRVDFFTVPGPAYYNEARRSVLEGVDGVVFVADSDPQRMDANVVALENLAHNLASFDRRLRDLPLAFQWNKQDLPDALAPSSLSAALNRHGAPEHPAVATRGEGVWESQQALLRLVVERLRSRVGSRARG